VLVYIEYIIILVLQADADIVIDCFEYR